MTEKNGLKKEKKNMAIKLDIDRLVQLVFRLEHMLTMYIMRAEKDNEKAQEKLSEVHALVEEALEGTKKEPTPRNNG